LFENSDFKTRSTIFCNFLTAKDAYSSVRVIYIVYFIIEMFSFLYAAYYTAIYSINKLDIIQFAFKKHLILTDISRACALNKF